MEEEELLVKAFLTDNSLSCGKITKRKYQDDTYIDLEVQINGKELYFSRLINSKELEEIQEAVGLSQLINMYVKEVQKAENPETEDETEIETENHKEKE